MLKPQPIRSQLRAILRNRICNGDFQPETILSPADLAKHIGVSPTPIREALIELARDGLLNNAPNRGFLVPPFSAAEVGEIYPLMRALEALALRSAPPTAAQLDKLVEINSAYTLAEGTRLADLDVEWHVELLRGCNNATLLELIDQLRWRIRRYEIDYLREHRWSTQAPVQHHAMVLALRRGDLDRAAELLALNWQQGFDLIATGLKE